MSVGRVVMDRIESEVLRGNAANDPHQRVVPVYLPPSYDAEPDRRYPVIYVLSGFTGRGRMLLNDSPWSEPLDRRMDRLIGAGSPEAILVMPDCFTRYGGSQYLDSSASGLYEQHLVSELVTWIDGRYRTLPKREHRGIAGKSSGGYGALVHGMRHPDVFGAVACHSGDMVFEYCYLGDVPKFASAIQASGGVQPWLEEFERKLQKKHDDIAVLDILGMAASYSPDPDSPDLGIALPCDPVTGAFRPQVWERWLACDPYRMLDHHAEALRSLALLYLDCGTRDEFHLHLGARLFTRRLQELGIRHEYEEFDDGHMNVGYRYDGSLPRLARALTP